MTAKRKDEVAQLLVLSPAEVQQRASSRLIVCDDLEALHQKMAQDIARNLQQAAPSHPTRLILPVGPTGQYPYLAKMIREQNISLDNCWLFFMDEYCDEHGNALSAEHPLSFKRSMEELFFSQLDDRGSVNWEQVIFPDEHNIERLPSLIAEIGGIDVCYGGIGIHGHLAFNEPEAGVKTMSARKVRLNDFTVTINAVRSQVGGNLEGFPREAYTLGLKEILAARQIRLYCRNGTSFDWANSVLRLALFGEPGDDYPVTHIRGLDYVIITDRDTLSSPRYLI